MCNQVIVWHVQQQQRPGSAGGSSPFRKSASPAGHSGGGGGSGAESRHGSNTEVRRSVSPHLPQSTAAGGSTSGTPSRLGAQQHRDKSSPARPTNDRTQHMAKSSPLHTQELLNKGRHTYMLV